MNLSWEDAEDFLCNLCGYNIIQDKKETRKKELWKHKGEADSQVGVERKRAGTRDSNCWIICASKHLITVSGYAHTHSLPQSSAVFCSARSIL